MKLMIGGVDHYKIHFVRVQSDVPTIESCDKVAFGSVGEILACRYTADLTHKVAIVKFEGVSRPCEVHDYEVTEYRPH